MKFANSKKIDKYLLMPTLLLLAWGLFHFYIISIDGSYYYFQRQLIWVALGFFFLFLFCFIPVKLWSKLAYIIFLATVILLALVLIRGEVVFGARRWLEIGLVRLQPSEFAKIALIITLSRLLAKREQIKWNIACLSFVLTLPLFILIAAQPDLGTAFIIFSIWLILLFASGISLRRFVAILGIIAAFIPISYNLLQPYQKMRIMSFLNPYQDPLGAGWSSLQSKIALGSGMLFGKEIGEAAHTKLRYLPQPFTDFIFSSMGEQWGFIGVLMLITAYAIIVVRGILIALSKGNSFPGLLATGVTTLIAIQAFVNMGMASGIIPVIGIPLPFISYGGSSTILFLSGIGILLAISKEK